jgi:transposase
VQLGHGAVRQVCLAHLLRDATYAIEASDAGFAPAFKRLLLRAVAIGKRRGALKDSTLTQYRADLDRLLCGPPLPQAAARRLFRAMPRDRTDLLRFVTRRDVPYTNYACRRALRPLVILSKVTNRLRAEWGAKVYAAAASVIATGRLHGLTALTSLRAAHAGAPVMR